ncbi:ABC-2 type transport system permease protein [Actinoplanes tereljensis]|uniref:Exporter of polyketide antibiotics n=1 Tax=Paractinoplanes tereljensis TaxID=571912 RepID=A0A919NZH7_9ACTN|nr:ABC transporter permease [Actinoplanes tereljensis]GIF26669.1 exporter of polyketide antibiotics [Actinoplanes tereljensis]
MTGTLRLLRFMLRRERRGLPWWLAGVTVLLLSQSGQSQSLYGTPEKLATMRRTIGGNTAAIAMNGPTRLLDSIGGEVMFEVFGFIAIVVALMNMFLVGRQTRGDEETGRSELIRSTPVGRRAPLAAALSLAALTNLVAGLLVFAAAAGTGLPIGGSLLAGAAVVTVGLTFAAFTAVAAQLFENVRAVYGAVGFLLGTAYVLRAAGDVGNGSLSWLSPIGWGQRTYPYAGDRWWPLLLPLLATTLLVAAAVGLLERRDFGAGLVRTRLGPATASRALGNVFGLAWRLQRGALIGWVAGLALLGAAYGSIGNTIEQYVRDNPEIAQFLPPGSILDSYLALTVGLAALIAAAYGVTCVLRLRTEETSGHAESILATATGRLTWLAGHLSVALGGTALALLAIGVGEGSAYALTVADPGQVPRLIGVAFAYLPAVWLVAAVAVLAVGWLPRAAAAAAWLAVAYCVVIALFADSFDLPGWVQRASPFAQTPRVPLEALAVTPLLVIVAVATVLVATGYAGLRRRDVGY